MFILSYSIIVDLCITQHEMYIDQVDYKENRGLGPERNIEVLDLVKPCGGHDLKSDFLEIPEMQMPN